ncbi:MAG: hypothetical protein VR72_05540 [Clostridiaceae bacterium BRH_c20a]|nr:MAG: hypothetical protein VR72_05540 [Clostridiaceae bacterium BRH_c20a]
MAKYLLLFLIFFILTAFIPIQIHFTYKRENNKNKLKVQIKILFITINQSVINPILKIISFIARKKYTSKNIHESMHAQRLPERNWGLILKRINIWLPRGIQIISHSVKLTSRILKPIKCKKLNIYTEVGLFDASQTGLAFGSLWAVYSFLISQLSKWMILKRETPIIKIVPDFNNSKLNLEYDCIIAFPLGHIIIVLIQTARFVRLSYHLIKGVTNITKTRRFEYE